MPPKKRKASEDSDDEASGSKARTSKKTAAAGSAQGDDSGIASNGQPTNKILPTEIKFPDKIDGTVRISSWNVSGLAASQKKVSLLYVYVYTHIWNA